MRKICNHPYLFCADYPEDDPNMIFKCSGKFELIDRILPKIVNSGHKVLIFSQFVMLLQLLSTFLYNKGVMALTLDGTMDQKLRE